MLFYLLTVSYNNLSGFKNITSASQPPSSAPLMSFSYNLLVSFVHLPIGDVS